MNLDLTKLNSGFLSELEIKEEFTIPTEFYQKTSILELKNLTQEFIKDKTKRSI